MTTNINEHQIRELLRVNNYSQIEPCLRQIMQAIQKHSNLRPVMDTFQDSSTNFQPTNLLKLTGTLSIFYKNSTYHIPIDCFIPKTAPSWPPVTYVRPTSTMKLVHENNRNLGPDGKIYDQYITSWANSKGANRSNLRDCLDKFVKIFSARPPVCSTGNSQARPSPAAQPAGGQYQPYSAYPGMTSTQSTNYPPTSNYQPPTTGATAGSVPYPTNTPYPAMPYPTNNLPNYQGFNHGGSVYGQGHTPANQPPGYMNVVGEAGPPSQTQSNQRTQPPNRPPPPGQNLNRTSSISDNVVKDSLLIEANNLLIENASSKKDNDKKEISNMTNVLNQLNDNASNIESNVKNINEEIEKLTALNASLQSEIIVKQNEISEMSQTDGIEVDELIVAKTPLEKQIFKNHCEDLAIQDCLYELSVALRKSTIDLAAFNREIRNLGRKQFKLRAQIQKARKQGGLSEI